MAGFNCGKIHESAFLWLRQTRPGILFQRVFVNLLAPRSHYYKFEERRGRISTVHLFIWYKKRTVEIRLHFISDLLSYYFLFRKQRWIRSHFAYFCFSARQNPVSGGKTSSPGNTVCRTGTDPRKSKYLYLAGFGHRRRAQT
jgi:hypothetical protein